jgi:outer membrane protein assembly factor BamB
MSAMVSAGGRIFYIFDHGPVSAIVLPPEWKLVARDAFNGTKLWERRIPTWHPHLWPMKSGFAQLPRRLVADGNRVFAVLGHEAPLTCLDAATGKTLRTYGRTRSTEEVLFRDGVLYVLVNDGASIHRTFAPKYDRKMGNAMMRAAMGWPWDGKPRRLRAVRAESGELLWEKRARVVPLTLTVGSDSVYFHDGERVLALARKDGKERWRSKPAGVHFPLKEAFHDPVRRPGGWRPEKLKGAFVPSSFAPTLVAHRGVVLFAGGDLRTSAYDARDGSLLWQGEHQPSGHFCPQDLFVIDGLVWSGAIANPKPRQSGAFVGLDLRTGAVKRKLRCDTDVYFMHQRCYRSKATERYLVAGRTGTEFVDLKTGRWNINHWVRGGCMYGMLPCNGLLYATPHSCACYMLSKLSGLNALSAGRGRPAPAAKQEPPLQRGPASERAPDAGAGDERDAWPTYRHDAARSGYVASDLPTRPKRAWRTMLGGRLSAPTIAGRRVYVAQIDRHAVVALDAEDGKVCWRFTAGARVDSPPTCWKGRCLFGCRDGHVYCLDAASGRLIWRRRVAPASRLLAAHGQLESPWPLHGSVLVHGNVLYAVAGRSMFLDGGIRFAKLDPATGRLLGERVYDRRSPDGKGTLQSRIKIRQMAVALPDVLSCDGKHLFMRHQCFDLDGVRLGGNPEFGVWTREAAHQGGETMHLFSPVGFLDGAWWHRSYWIYGKRFVAGAVGYPLAGKHAAGGRILVHDAERVYGFGRTPAHFTWTTPLEYRLFAVQKKLEEYTKKFRWPPRGKRIQKIPATRAVEDWSRRVPVLARGMVASKNALLVAGPPDVVNEQKAFFRLGERATRRRLSEQVAALEGRKGASLWALAKESGKALGKWKLEAPPTWDGMAAAYGRLYLAQTDGHVLCLGEKGDALPALETVEPAYRDPSLVGHWRMNEAEGDFLRDASERGNDAVLDAKRVPGRDGGAVRIAGRLDTVSVPDDPGLNPTDALTLAAWVKRGRQQVGGGAVVHKKGPRGGFSLRLDARGRPVAVLWNARKSRVYRADKVLSDGWHHLALTAGREGKGKVRLFLDGELLSEGDAVAWGAPVGSELSIGGRAAWAYRGDIDEVRIYRRELSGAEVKALAVGAAARRRLRDVVGVCHAKGLYHLTDKDFLNEGADAILELGSRVIKFWLTNGPETPGRMYPWNSKWPEARTMVETAKLPYFRKLFAKPFTTYLMNVTSPGRPYYWKNGITKEQEAAETRNFCELTRYLLKTYRGTGKTFVLQHHEGDWHVRGHTRKDEDPKPAALANMVRWLNARQAGVNKARREVKADGVRVYHAAEVNLVLESLEKNRPNMVNKVLPHTRLDLVSFSAWSATVPYPDDPGKLRKALDFIAEKTPDSPDFGARNVYLGEYGLPENNFDEVRLKKVIANSTRTALDWGCPYVLYWQIYCNEANKGSKAKPPIKTNKDARGFWLIRPDGSKSWAWGYFKKLLSGGRGRRRQK